ncbi:hypothetical protein Tco_0170450, partial [Tanacetum coccineum]
MAEPNSPIWAQQGAGCGRVRWRWLVTAEEGGRAVDMRGVVSVVMAAEGEGGSVVAAVKGGGARCRDSGGWEMMILGGGRSGSGVRGGAGKGGGAWYSGSGRSGLDLSL